MSSFTDKIRRGLIPTDADWEAHLIEAHKLEPRMTPDAFGAYKAADGRNSYEILAEVVPQDRTANVVDLGCGDGHFIPYLLRRLSQESQVIGVDMSPDGLELAKAHANDKRVRLIEARAQALPLADASQDFVLSHMAFMLMAPFPPVIDEIRRVLKPGGVFSTVYGGGSVEGLYKEIQRLVGLFTEAHLPRLHEARRASTRLANLEELFAEGFDKKIVAHEFHLHYHVPPEGVWDYMRNMYFVAMLTEDVRREFKDDLLAAARDHRDESGRVTFKMPMRQITIKRI